MYCCGFAVETRGPPQWGVRGGGGRNRGVGGRYRGLDPVVPVTEPEILSTISDFYGISQDFPLWDQIITRYWAAGVTAADSRSFCEYGQYCCVSLCQLFHRNCRPVHLPQCNNLLSLLHAL